MTASPPESTALAASFARAEPPPDAIGVPSAQAMTLLHPEAVQFGYLVRAGAIQGRITGTVDGTEYVIQGTY